VGLYRDKEGMRTYFGDFVAQSVENLNFPKCSKINPTFKSIEKLLKKNENGQEMGEIMGTCDRVEDGIGLDEFIENYYLKSRPVILSSKNVKILKKDLKDQKVERNEIGWIENSDLDDLNVHVKLSDNWEYEGVEPYDQWMNEKGDDDNLDKIPNEVLFRLIN